MGAFHPTKTVSLVHAVVRDILYGKYQPGEKLPSERDMALQTGTSRITAQRAFDVLTDRGVLERRPGSGTYVATARKRTNEKMDYVALLASIRYPFAAEFVEEFERIVAEQDALFVLRLTDLDPQKEKVAAIDLVAKGIRNLVVWPSRSLFAADAFERMHILGTNIVFFDCMVPGDYADFVGVDNDHAMKSLVTAMLQDGAEELLLVSYEGIPADSDRLREEAFLRHCGSAGIAHRLVHVPWQGDLEQVMRQYKATWFEGKSGLGVICINDEMALRVKACMPEIFRVCGVDGLPEASKAGITSYRQPVARMARETMHLLLEQQRQGALWRPCRRLFKGRILTESGKRP